MVLRRKIPRSFQSSSLLSLQPQVLGIKALDTAAVVLLLLSALLKIKALQANSTTAKSLVNDPCGMAALRWRFLMHVCKAGGKGILRNPQLNRWRGTVYPTPLQLLLQHLCRSRSKQPVPKQRSHNGSAPGGFPAWGKEKDV